MVGSSRAIKTIQANLGRGKAALALAQQKFKEESIDVLMIQEPFHTFGNWTDAQCIGEPGKSKVITIVRNKNWKVTQLKECSSKHCVATKLEWLSRELLIINVYIPRTVAMHETLHMIGRTLAAYPCPVIIGGDFNAWNPLWGGS